VDPPTVADVVPAASEAPPVAVEGPAAAPAPATAPAAVALAPTASDPGSSIVAGELYWLDELTPGPGEEERPTVLIEAGPAPRPIGPVVAHAEVHGGRLAFRELDVAPPARESAVVARGATLCETPIVRARRLHATSLHVDDRTGVETERPGTSYLAYELERCEDGQMAVLGVPLAQVRSHLLERDAMTAPAPPGLIELVRTSDEEASGSELAMADFRMLALPRAETTLVTGAMTWVVRDGRVLNAPFRGNPSVALEAGPRVFFVLDSEFDSWVSPLECFYPTYDAGSCVVIDESGTPANVRATPSGRGAVLTTVARGNTVTADDHVGSWFHLRTSPPGWAHASGLRCAPLPRHPAPCP